MKNGKINTLDKIQGFSNAIMYFIAPITLKLMDILTTAKFLSLGIKEGNPIIAWFMSIDLNLAYAVSFFGGLSSFAILYYLEHNVSKINGLGASLHYFRFTFKIIYFLLIGVSIYVVIHNLTIISYSDTRILV